MAAKRKPKKIQIAQGLEITQTQHEALTKYMGDRLEFGNQSRQGLIDRFRIIDREMAGYLVLDEDDKKREQDNIAGYGPKVTDVIIPLVLSQADEAVTFLLSVLVPDDAMYQAIAVKDKQAIAKAFAMLMNKHGDKFKHFKHYARFLMDAMKYNIAAVGVDWVEIKGTKISNGQGGIGVEIEEDTVVAEGNELTTLDMYNTIFDPTVDLTDTAAKGEFFATIALHTPFRVRKMEQDGEIFGINRFIDKATHHRQYFEQKPIVRNDGLGSSYGTDWIDILSSGVKKGVSEGIEFITMPMWVPVKQFGLGEEDKMEIWRLTLVTEGASEGGHIVAAEKLNNAHGLLPIGVAMPWEDGMGMQTKSYAELLLPYQRFASFQMNVHQRAARKSLYGLTIYDKQQIPLMEKADALAGKIPASPTSTDRDVRKAIVQFNDAPDTSNTLRDIDAVDSLMQKILPTDMLKQVTDLERATQYQAAATVQGANRRNLKIARIIDAQAFSDIRMMQMYNIYQFQEQVEMIGADGVLTTFKPAEVRDAGIEFDISDGLKGLDKLSLISFYQQMLNAALQSQQINENMDVVALLDYMSTIMGDKTDIGQFKFQNEFDKLNPEEKQLAFQLLQQAAQQQEGGAGGAQTQTQ